MPFVLSRLVDGEVRIYWTGYRHVNGEPEYTLRVSKAFSTKTSDELLAAVRTHPEINWDVWKVKLWREI